MNKCFFQNDGLDTLQLNTHWLTLYFHVRRPLVGFSMLQGFVHGVLLN